MSAGANEKMSPLAELVQVVCEANGWSYADVARRATVAGEKLSKQNLSRLLREFPLVSITGSAVAGLAAGLGVSPDRVAVAAFESMGFKMPHLEVTSAEVIQRDLGLSADTRAALLAILRSAT